MPTAADCFQDGDAVSVIDRTDHSTHLRYAPWISDLILASLFVTVYEEFNREIIPLLVQLIRIHTPLCATCRKRVGPDYVHKCLVCMADVSFCNAVCARSHVDGDHDQSCTPVFPLQRTRAGETNSTSYFVRIRRPLQHPQDLHPHNTSPGNPGLHLEVALVRGNAFALRVPAEAEPSQVVWTASPSFHPEAMEYYPEDFEHAFTFPKLVVIHPGDELQLRALANCGVFCLVSFDVNVTLIKLLPTCREGCCLLCCSKHAQEVSVTGQRCVRCNFNDDDDAWAKRLEKQDNLIKKYVEPALECDMSFQEDLDADGPNADELLQLAEEHYADRPSAALLPPQPEPMLPVAEPQAPLQPPARATPCEVDLQRRRDASGPAEAPTVLQGPAPSASPTKVVAPSSPHEAHEPPGKAHRPETRRQP